MEKKCFICEVEMLFKNMNDDFFFSNLSKASRVTLQSGSLDPRIM